MFRLTAYVLAAFAMISFFAVAEAQAGNRHERRIHNHQKHSILHKRRHFRMKGISVDSGRKRVSRGTLAFRPDRLHRHRYRHHARPRVNTSTVVIISVDGNRQYRLPVNSEPDVNTYSGDVDIYSVPGVGTYSYGDAVDSADTSSNPHTPSAKIIDVSDLEPNSGCEMQAGVCVIRP